MNASQWLGISLPAGVVCFVCGIGYFCVCVVSAVIP